MVTPFELSHLHLTDYWMIQCSPVLVNTRKLRAFHHFPLDAGCTSLRAFAGCSVLPLLSTVARAFKEGNTYTSGITFSSKWHTVPDLYGPLSKKQFSRTVNGRERVTFSHSRHYLW